MIRRLLASAIVVAVGASTGAGAGSSAGAVPPIAPAPTASARTSSADTPTSPFGSEEADQVLFGDAKGDLAAREACRGPKPEPEPERIRCLLGVRYRDDANAAGLALDLYARTGNLAGVDVDHVFDGGYRGPVHILPAVPSAALRPHLAWVASAFREYEAFFRVVPSARYRYRDLAIRFFSSEGKRTPSAYATGWTIAYNVSGAINVSEQSVRETLFHELFHLNDEFRDHWSKTALVEIRDAILRKCGTSTPCLTPYAPASTIVKGSTYYAFHPANGADEYGAELALRYFREERAAIRKEALPGKPFKCLTPENAKAWTAIAREFFGGYDATPSCSSFER